jgi:hypothetical protein
MTVTDWKPLDRTAHRCRDPGRVASRKKPNSVSGMTDISVIPDTDFWLR